MIAHLIAQVIVGFVVAGAITLVIVCVRDYKRTFHNECCWDCTPERVCPDCTLHNA